MAEIPVERKKGGFPWWLIPLLLLLLLLPLLYFTCGRNDTTVVSNANGNRTAVTNANSGNVGATTNGNGASAANSGNAATSGAMNANGGNTALVSNTNSGSGSGAGAGGTAISDVNAFGTASDKAALVGRQFSVNGVRVERVLSDRVFTVKSGTGEMFVLLDENLDSGGGKEQQIKMRSGQIVNLSGDFRGVPNAETKNEQNRDLNAREYAQMKDQQVYLHARSVSDAK